MQILMCGSVHRIPRAASTRATECLIMTIRLTSKTNLFGKWCSPCVSSRRSGGWNSNLPESFDPQLRTSFIGFLIVISGLVETNWHPIDSPWCPAHFDFWVWTDWMNRLDAKSRKLTVLRAICWCLFTFRTICGSIYDRIELNSKDVL